MSFSEINKLETISDGQASIVCTDGECFINSSVDIMGIQINFKGKAEITPDLPEGWFLQGNDNTILIFTLSNIPLQSRLLFNYLGSLEIKTVIISDVNGKSVNCILTDVKPKWKHENWSLDSEAGNWDSFKDKVKVGIINKTKYNLPDYDLPKVEKITRKKRQNYEKITRNLREASRSTGGY